MYFYQNISWLDVFKIVIIKYLQYCGKKSDNSKFFLIIKTSVVDPHHVDVDPVPDTRIRIGENGS